MLSGVPRRALMTGRALMMGRASMVRREYSSTEEMLAEWRASNFGTFKASELSVELTTKANDKPKDWDHLLFGHTFSDHMLQVEWDVEGGWGKPAITPLRNLQLHPAAKVFHYAIELFEGMKAYRGVDNKIRIFRPDMNMKRMNNTAARACLPTFEGSELIKCLEELIRVDQDWVPYSTSSSLYIRPTFIGTEPHLGLGASTSAVLYIITGPVGPFFPTGFKPITLYADPGVCRAWPGGAGSTKMGSNYAPTILIGRIAEGHGCQQVLWLFGDHEALTEVGTMNIFLFLTNEQGEKELVTPELESGLILPGITRQSLLDLAREWNEFKVSERTITMSEVQKALNENRLHEVFGTGTACIVSPVSRILYKKDGKEQMLEVPTMAQSPCLMQRFFDTFTDIHYGRVSKPKWQHLLPTA